MEFDSSDWVAWAATWRGRLARKASGSQFTTAAMPVSEAIAAETGHHPAPPCRKWWPRCRPSHRLADAAAGEATEVAPRCIVAPAVAGDLVVDRPRMRTSRDDARVPVRCANTASSLPTPASRAAYGDSTTALHRCSVAAMRLAVLLKPYMEALAPTPDHRCLQYRAGRVGHYVKMVHNGIEYA